MFHCKCGVTVGIWHNPLGKEREEICEVTYTPAAVPNETKYMGSRNKGKHLTLEGGVVGDRAQVEIHM